MGWVWDRLLLNERLARWYYKHMMGVAMKMTPRPEGLPWFDRTRLRMQELQRKVRVILYDSYMYVHCTCLWQ